MLTCYDPRLEQQRIAEELAVSRATVKKLLQRLRLAASREKRRIVAVHLRRLEAFRVKGVLVELEPSLARGLVSVARRYHGSPVPPGALEGLVPEPRLLGAVFVLEGDKVLATYRVLDTHSLPEALLNDQRIRRILEPGFVSVPVMGCFDPREAREEFWHLLAAEAPRPRLLVDLLVLGVLDANPLARLNWRDFDPSHILMARLGLAALTEDEARRIFRVLRARYRVLSLYRIVGRVYYVRPSDYMRSKALIVAPRDHAADIYAAAVETMGAAYVAAGEELTLVTSSAEATRLHSYARRLGATVRHVLYHFAMPPPLEYAGCDSEWLPAPAHTRLYTRCITELLAA